MIRYAQAVERLIARSGRLAAEACPLGEAVGRVLAEAVASPMELPSFDHAAMDGYALDARRSLPAGSEHAVVGSLAAGDAVRGVAEGAVEIMTGAPLPAGRDAVIPVERTELLERGGDGSPARIRLLAALADGDNVRRAGSDVAEGMPVIAAGTRLGPSHVMLLAALGVAEVTVARRPRVAVICTGKELSADSRQPLADGQIRNSNGPYLVAAFAAAGARVLSCDTVDDTAGTYREALGRARADGADLVVSTGAVSMGRYDFVPEQLRRLGAEPLFHKVAIRPGKPQLAAAFDGGPLVIGLPGTPMAVAVGFRFFVVPVLRAMAGLGAEPVLRAVLDTTQQPKPGLRHFLRAGLRQDADGRLHARVFPQQQPFRILPFARSDAWVVLPEDAGTLAAGASVDVVALHPWGGIELAGGEAFA